MQIAIPPNVPVDAIILVDINGTPIDFMLTSNFYNRSSDAISTTISAQTTVKQLLATNTNRKGKPSIYYDGTAVMYLLMGSGVPSATNYTIKLGAGLLNYFEPSVDNFIGPISAIWSAANGSAQVTEFM